MRNSRVFIIAIAAGAFAFTAGAAVAQQTPQGSRVAAPDRLAEARGVLICKTDDASRRSFVRRYGERPVFITAREALTVRRNAPSWSAPRCMTEREHTRYERAAARMARTR